jgi:hypothetical protein
MRPEIIERADLLLPRGIWQLDVPSAHTRLFLLVTSTGKMLLQRAPLDLSAQSEDEVLRALDAILFTIDPTPRLVADDPVTAEIPRLGADTLRVIRELGLVDEATLTKLIDAATH